MTREIAIPLPDDPKQFTFPRALDRRLQLLLDRNNNGELSREERLEAEGLVDVAQLLSLLKLRLERARLERQEHPKNRSSGAHRRTTVDSGRTKRT
jgi:hypothetical protein